MLYLLRDFSAIAILWYRVSSHEWCSLNLPGKTQVIKIFLPLRVYGTECPHMNGVGLNLPGKTQIIKIDRTSILNNDGMVACGFLG